MNVFSLLKKRDLLRSDQWGGIRSDLKSLLIPLEEKLETAEQPEVALLALAEWRATRRILRALTLLEETTESDLEVSKSQQPPEIKRLIDE